MALILKSTIQGTNFTGTASLATQAVSSSYSEFAVSASYFSGSVEFATSASLAATASFLSGSIESASYAATASYALTASYISGGLGEGFPYTGSAAISGTLDVNPSPFGIDSNYLEQGSGTIATIGKGLTLQYNGAADSILLGTFNDKTDRGYPSTFPKFVVAAGVNDSFRKNIVDYRIGASGVDNILLLGHEDDRQGFIAKEFTFKRSGSEAGKLIVEEPVEVDIKGKSAISGALGVIGAITASSDISASGFVTARRLNVIGQVTASFISASLITGDINGTSQRISGSFSGSFNGDFYGNIFASNVITTGSIGQHQAITGSLTILGGLNVIGSASFTYVTSSNLLVNDNTITVFADSVGAINTAGLVAVDSASLSNSGSLLYDITTQKWNADRDFVIPAVTASNAIVIGDGADDNTFRLRVSASALYVEALSAGSWFETALFKI